MLSFLFGSIGGYLNSIWIFLIIVVPSCNPRTLSLHLILYCMNWIFLSVIPGLLLRWIQHKARDLLRLIPIFLTNSSFNPVLVKSKWKRFWLYLMKLAMFFPRSLLNFSKNYYLFFHMRSASDFPGGGGSFSNFFFTGCSGWFGSWSDNGLYFISSFKASYCCWFSY